MKNKFKVISVLWALLIFGSSFSYGAGYDNSFKVRVGIFYGAGAKSSYSVGGTGLGVGIGNQLVWSTAANNFDVSKPKELYVSSELKLSYEEAYTLGGMVYYSAGYYYQASTLYQPGYALNLQNNILIQANDGRALALVGDKDQYIQSSDEILTLNGTKYREKINIYNNGTRIIAINVIGLDNYLNGVVPKEMPSSWHPEALKAQIIVARNYVITNFNKHRSEGFNVCNTIHCQVYGGLSGETASTNAAVSATSGEIMYYGGAPAEGYFHSSSGGRTESSGNIWNSNLPYLMGVEDSYSLGSPHDNWTVAMNGNEIRLQLASNGINIGAVTGLSISKVSENGRALELIIYGQDGSYTLQKDRIRTVLGSSKFKSTYFTIGETSSQPITVPAANKNSLDSIFNALGKVIEVNAGSASGNMASGNNFTFYGKGYGHGVGMSQYGAKGMADKGHSYKDILTHYFTGVQVSR